jgi:streptogramin lyase
MKRCSSLLLCMLSVALATVMLAARSDAATVHVVGSVKIGADPGGVAAGFGSVWVADPSRGTIDRIDTETNRTQARIYTGGSPNFVAVGDGGVWASNTYSRSGYQAGRTIVEIAPIGNRVVRRISVGPFPSQLALAKNSVWIAVQGANALVRVPLRGGSIRSTAVEQLNFSGPPNLVWNKGPVGVAVAGGAVWAASPAADAFFRIDPGSGRLTRADSLGQNAPCGRMDSSGLSIWVSSECGSIVWRINARSGAISSIDLGPIPDSGLIGDVLPTQGAAWVTTDGGQLLKIDSRLDRVAARYRLPSNLGAGSLTFAAGSLWESDFGDLDHGEGRLVRIQLPPGQRAFTNGASRLRHVEAPTPRR